MSDLTEKNEPRLISVGVCPACGNPVIESKVGYGCSGYKDGCTFILWKKDKFLKALKKNMTKKIVKDILTEGTTFLEGATSKKGHKFDCIVSYGPSERGYSWTIEEVMKNPNAKSFY